MSRNGKNNHYHYAEKFSDRKRRSAAGKRAFMPFKSVIISLVVLLMFGLTCTTFSVYVDDNTSETEAAEAGLIADIRNIKESRDIAFTGADVDLATSGWKFQGTSYFYFDNYVSGWDGTIQLLIGKSGYTSVYEMSQVSDTNYYACSLTDIGWTDATYMAVISADSVWGSGSWGPSNRTNADHYTNTYTAGCDATDTQRYLLTPASGSNNCALSLAYKGINNKSMDLITIKAHACYCNNTNKTTYTTDNATGGTVWIESWYFDSYNSIASSDTLDENGNGANKATYNAVKTLSRKTSNLKAKAKSGYRFVGWFSSVSDTVPVSDSATYSFSTYNGDKELYAKFLKTYTVTINKSPSNYSGTGPTVDGNSSSSTVDIGDSVTLVSNAPNGVTAVWKQGSASGSTVTSPYTPTANVSLYCCYSLNAPTISSFSYSDSGYAEGGSAMAPSYSITPAVNSNESNLRCVYSLESSPDDGDCNLTTSGANNGYFSATIAGKYKVRLTVTETYENLSSTNYAEYEINVRPTAVTDADVGYIADKFNSGLGTASAPWKTPKDRTAFNIHTFINEGHEDEDYTYTWTRTEGTYIYTPATSAVTRTGGSVTAVETDDVYEVTDYASASGVIHNTVCSTNDNEGWYYKVSITKTRNSVTSAAYDCYFYYGVTEDFLIVTKFDFSQFNDNEGEEVQKIYAEENGIDHISADYDVGGTKFKTMLWFSKNNIEFSKVAVWTLANNPIQIPDGIFAGEHYPLPDDSAHRTDTLIRTLSTIARNNVNLMSTTGPKWFRGYIDDYNNPRIAAQTPDIHNSIKDTNDLYTVRHTTVGTSSSSADRAVYYNDNTGKTYPNTRVMAFYVLDGEEDVCYQTAQKLTGTRYQYRFYVPVNTKYISFAHVVDNNYLLPTFSSNTFAYSNYTSVVLKAWSETLDLSANLDKCLYTANAYTTASGINYYTGVLSSFN